MMLKHEEVINILKRELTQLSATYGVKRLALFGSFAKGTEKKNSDVDILVEFKKPIGLKFVDLAEYLEKLVNRKVDILTPEGIRSIRIKKVAQDIRKDLVYV